MSHSGCSGSGGFRDCGAWGQKCLWCLCLKIFINQIILQIVFRQNSDASKLCSVASDESFVSFLCINELYRKKACFLIFSKIYHFASLTEKYITENTSSWKTVKHFLSNKVQSSERINLLKKMTP